MRLIIVSFCGDPPLFAFAKSYKLISVYEMPAIDTTGIELDIAFAIFTQILHLSCKGISV